MPVREDLHIPPTDALPRDTFSPTQRPSLATVRDRSVTPAPEPVPDLTTPKSPLKPEEPTEIPPATTIPEAPSPAPPLQEEQDPEPEQDEDPASTLAVIDMDTFNQILELDEDEETRDFSQPMVWSYFEQAEETFENMEKALVEKDLEQLSALGHFLKGSSAALGLSRVQDTCESIQHLGQRRDEETKSLTDNEALAEIAKMVKRVKIQYTEAEIWLKDFFAEED